jgi:hypothetical protein
MTARYARPILYTTSNLPTEASPCDYQCKVLAVLDAGHQKSDVKPPNYVNQ